jgi:predicted ester cyclase
VHATHVGNALPRLAGLPISGRTVHWARLHAFRVEDDMAVEHWAVRDDFGLVDQLSDT